MKSNRPWGAVALSFLLATARCNCGGEPATWRCSKVGETLCAPWIWNSNEPTDGGAIFHTCIANPFDPSILMWQPEQCDRFGCPANSSYSCQKDGYCDCG